MSVKNLILPPHYFSKLDIMETEVAIKLAKDTFERELAEALSLTRVSALSGLIFWSSRLMLRSSIRWQNGSAWHSAGMVSRPEPAFIPI